MKVSVERNIVHALLVDPVELETLAQLLLHHFKTISVWVECSNGTTIDDLSIDELLKYDNSKRRHITELHISAGSPIDERAAVDFTHHFFTKAQIEIVTKNSDDTEHLQHDVLGILREMRPRYSWITRVSFLGYAAVGLISLSLLAMLGESTGWLKPTREESPSSFRDFASTAVVIGILFSLDELRKWLFPPLFFLIGKQREEYERRKDWRRIIFVVILLGILVSAFGSYLIKRFRLLLL